MSVMKRLSGIVQAKTNKLLDKAEDPRESLDLSYQKQLESLQKVRRSVADVTTAKKRIELQATQLQQQADKLQSRPRPRSPRATRTWPGRPSPGAQHSPLSSPISSPSTNRSQHRNSD